MDDDAVDGFASMAEDGVTGPAGSIHYELQLDGHANPSLWRPRRIRVEEGLSGETSASVVIETDDGDADAEALLGTSATLLITRSGLQTERFSGIVRWIGDAEWTTDDRLTVGIEIEPAFACLQEEAETRCFMGMSRPAVIEQVLGAALAPFGRNAELQLDRLNEKPDSPRRYPKLDFVQQRSETTYAFARRLMAEEGMTYFFDQSGDVEKMIVVDDNRLFPERKGTPVELMPASGTTADVQGLSAFTLSCARRPATFACRGFDATRPALALQHEARTPERPDGGRNGAPGAAGIYDPLTPFALHGYKQNQYTATDIEVQAQLRLEATQREARVASGQGNLLALRAGTVFTLDGTSLRRSSWAGRYLLTRIVHRGEVDDSGTGTYSNQFSCIPATVPYRPTRLPRPKVAGIDLGMVTAGGDEQIWTDRHGRAKVRFLWDRKIDRPSENDSSWIPVVLNWAGPGYGMQIMPRKGMIVAIAYYGGDPDHPMIVGTLATTDNSHPHELPRLNSRVSIVSQSLRDGGRDTEHYHEITMEDAADNEQLIIRSGWDYLVKVLRDATTTIDRDEVHSVGNDQAVNVTGNRKRRVGKDEGVVVLGNRTDEVHGTEKRLVQQGQDLTIIGGRISRVTTIDTAVVTGDRQTQISGSDQIHVGHDASTTVDGCLKVTQGKTTIECAEGHIYLDAASWVRIKRGAVEVVIDDGNDVKVSTPGKVTLDAGEIAMSADRISIDAREEASLKVGGSAITLDGQEVKITGTNITETAASIHQTKAGLIMQN